MAIYSSSPSLQNFLNWSEKYLNFEKNPTKNIFWLTTMEFFCQKLNHPEREFKSFHVAGSKGKGSVSMFIASVLKEAGFKTGLYSSPHILDFSERITSSGESFDESIYSLATKELMDTVDSVPLEELPGQRQITWFELTTLLSFLCFKYAKVDWAVFEVGLGGRLDATNVIEPECCCITPIEKEHCEYLGNTLELIAGEKGGIIKSGVPVFIAPQQTKSVEEVFVNIAREKQSHIFLTDGTYKIDEIVYKSILTNGSFIQKDTTSRKLLSECPFVMETKVTLPCFSRPLNLSLLLPGEFQVQNAVLALSAVKKVIPDLDEAVAEKGLSSAKIPGRFEVVPFVKEFPNVTSVVLDGAHTPRSLNFTLETFRNYHSGKAVMLFACAADKDVESMASLIRDDKAFEKEAVFLTRPGDSKASDIGRAETAFKELDFSVKVNPDYSQAIREAFTYADKNKLPLLVTGSFYLVSEAKKFLS